MAVIPGARPDPPSRGFSAADSNPPGLKTVRIRGFRSIRDACFQPGPVSALVGQPGTGKSNLLAAIRAALDPKAEPLAPDDITRDGEATIRISVETADGSSVSVEGTPPSMSIVKKGEPPPVLYLPARLRAGRVVATTFDSSPQTDRASRLISQAIPSQAVEELPSAHRSGTTEAAHGLVEGMEACQRAGITGMILLIEEPELFLPPQAQRYLYRLLRHVAAAGNQVLYSTHSPSFLNVARLQELVLTEHLPDIGTRFVQPDPLPTDDEFRAYSEFDASRSEIFLARAAILVEGLTERLALPFVFQALGYDPDRELISIVECGGKANIPLVARISKAVGIPFIAVHDRDAPTTKRPNQTERQLNELIRQVAGDEGRVELIPDFEGVAGLSGHRHKPARAWRSFALLQTEDVPSPLAKVVERAVAIARR